MTTGPALQLPQIPGWTNARRSLISRGSNNMAYLLEDGDRRAVLKVARKRREFPLNRRADEARVQSVAQAAGLAPAVLYVDERVMLEEYLDGTPWTGATLSRPARLDVLGAALRRVHALPLTGRLFPLQDAARKYFEELSPRADRAHAERCLATVTAVAPPPTLCCCHNDLVAGNIVSAGGVVLLDWEYAGDNDPMFDLATVVTHHRVGPRGRKRLLHAYYGGADEHQQDLLERMSKVYAALAWLWHASRS